MRKNFLLVFLLAVLPLMGWATGTTPKTAAGLATGLTYNKGAQDLLTSKLVLPDDYDTSVGKVYYIALTGTGSPISSNPNWSESIPQGTDAGTYHLFYKITNDGTTNHDEETIASIGDVTIGKKTASAADGDFTAPTAVTGLVFDNTVKTIVEATKPESGHFVYQYRQQNTYSYWSGWSWTSWSGWSETLPTGTNARDYQIRYRYINEDGNYNDWSTSNYQQFTANIARATWGEGAAIYTAPKQKEDAIFNNTNQNMVTEGETPAGWGAEMQYGTTNWRNTVDHNDFRSTNVLSTNRTVYYRIQGGNGYNWNALAQTPIEGGVNILPAEAPDATGGALAASPLTYTAADQQLVTTGYTVTLLGGSAQVHYYVNGVDKGTAITGVTAKDQGEYEITYTLDYNNAQTRRNYKAVDPAKSLGTVKIDKVKLTIAGVGYSKDFDNTEFTATPENVVKLVDGIGWLGSESDEYKAEVLGALLEVKSGLPQINVGSHKVELQSKEDPNYSYVIDPMFHETADLNILKIDNTWKNDVSIAATWPYGSAPAKPSAEPNLTKKENGEDAEITFKYYTDAACTTEFTDPIDETMPVGVYYVKAFVEGCNNFFPLESVTPASFEITATSPTWTKAVAMAGWEYGQYSATDNAPTAEAIDDATITFKYYEDAGCTTEIAAEDLAALGVGKYYVKAFAAATANHTADENGPAEFEVTPTVLPEVGIADYEMDYTGDNLNPGAGAINALVLANTGLVAGTDYELSFDPSDDFTNVGEYWIIATGKGNYAKEVDGDVNTQKVKFTINPVDPEINAPVANLLTYTAEKQVLAKEATSTDGTFEYSLTGEDGSWTTDMPAGFNAGEYTVYTKFTPDGNHNEATVDPITVTIKQAQLKITLTNTFEKDWDGAEIPADQLEETYVIDGLLGDDAYILPFTLSLPATEDNNFIDAKVYELKKLNIEWNKDEEGNEIQNYKVAFVTVGSITINKADIAAEDFEAPVAIDDLEFTGEAQALVTAGKVITEYEGAPIGTILFAQGETAPAEDAADWTEDVPEQTNAGEYPVWFMVKGDDNHNNVAAAQLTGKIAPKPWDAVLAFEDAEVIYKGKDFMPTDLSIKDGEDAEEALEKDKDYTLAITNGAGEEAEKLIDVDTYTFTYTGIGNYEGSTATATITIDPAELTEDMLSAYETPLEYNMKDQNPNITLTYEGMTLEADKDFEAEVPAEFINAGTYEWTYTGIGNYTGDVTVKIVIDPLKAQAVAKDATKVYDGIAGLSDVEIEFTYTGLLKGEPEDAIAFADGVVSNAGDFLNVGEYVMEFDPTKFSSKNYEVVGVEKNGAKFTITPAPLTVAWNAEATPFTKVYGGEDPTFAGSEDNLVIVGAVNDTELAQIIADTQFSRVDGDDEAVGEHDLALGKKMYKDAYGNEYPAPIFDNYDVEFATPAAGAFTITTAAIYVSIAPQSKKYDGEAVADWTATEEQLVITDWLGNDLKADVFQEMPTAKVTDSKAQVGEYELTLTGGKAHDYAIEYLKSTFTIEPKPIEVTFTPQQVQVGEVVEDAIDSEAFAIEGLVAEADKALFAVDVQLSLVDENDKIIGTPGTYADGLVLISLDDDMTANYTGWETAGGELLIISGETVVLNDAEEGKFEAKTGVDVTFESRTVNAGTWNVCALPFATSPKQISDAFGFAAVDILNEASNDIDVHFTVLSSGTIPAYTPFLVKTTEDKDLVKTNFNQVTFYGVDIEAGNGENKAVSDAAGNKFIGTFQEATTFTGGQYLYMSKGDWYDASKRSVTLKPFRAYVELVNPKARIFIEEPDGTVTAIDAVRFNEEINAEGMFNLNGVKVNNINRKGVYIKNGVKVVK